MNHDHQNCEKFQILVSAMLDDELTPEEQTDLGQHLEQCDACRHLMNRFEAVNKGVELLSQPEHVPGGIKSKLEKTAVKTETFVVTRQKPSARDWLSVWRLIPLATAASVVFGLAFLATRTPEPVAAEQFSTEQFVKPVQELQFISEQQQRDQELMLKLLGMDLRSLRLELNQLDAESPERKKFSKRIDAMIERVREFESNNQ
jgi:anti-sigma-K factor RskA